MAIRSSGEIYTNIQIDLADNNAGAISAADIRNNMTDMLESMNHIVASGNFNSITPFVNDVKLQLEDGVGGKLIVGSGIEFLNGGGTQYVPYPGPGGISHNSLINLTVGNPHTQYMSIEGLNKATANMPMGDEWINSSGNLVGAPNTDDRGLKFEYTDTASGEIIHIGSDSTVKFDKDNSNTNSGKGIAQAWIAFNGYGDMEVFSSYNISGITRLDQGKFKITFSPGTFSDSLYTAIGNSNATTSAGSAEDFDVNTVGIVDRDKDYLTFLVRSDDNEYVNAAVNDLVVFGNAVGVTADSSPTINTEV
jgi:hypothetical protein